MSAYVFRCKTSEGFIFKSLIELLQNMLTDVCFTLTPEDIRLTTNDNKSNILLDLRLNAKAFDEYQSQEKTKIGINLQHLWKMVKSIKKKNSIELYVSKSEPELLQISSSSFDNTNKSGIKIQKTIEVIADIPTAYYHPIHIPSQAFQKLCKEMCTLSNTINISSQASFISFKCEAEGLYKRETSFGNKEHIDTSFYDYEDTFSTKLFSQFIKISGLNNKIQIYIPNFKKTVKVPLKIGINIGNLGTLCIFIKSDSQMVKKKTNISF